MTIESLGRKYEALTVQLRPRSGYLRWATNFGLSFEIRSVELGRFAGLDKTNDEWAMIRGMEPLPYHYLLVDPVKKFGRVLAEAGHTRMGHTNEYEWKRDRDSAKCVDIFVSDDELPVKLEAWTELFLDPLTASIVASELQECVNSVRQALRSARLSYSHYLQRGDYHHFATKGGRDRYKATLAAEDRVLLRG